MAKIHGYRDSVTGPATHILPRNAGASPPTDPRRSRPAGRSWQDRVPSIFSGVLTGLAVLCAFAAVSAAFYHRAQVVRVTVDNLLLPAPPNLGYAAFVGVLAAGVARRKRVAYWMLIIYFGVQLVIDLGLLAVYYLVRVMPEDFWGGE